LDAVVGAIEDYSSVTNWDYVSIVATHIASSKVFNCFDCKKAYPEQKRKELKGCFNPIKRPVAKYKDKIVFYKCPANFYSMGLAKIKEQARHLENGLLPYSGGLFDQPAKLVEIMNLFESLRIEDEITRLEADAKKQKQEAKKWRTK
jgi:hypothetical protein